MACGHEFKRKSSYPGKVDPVHVGLGGNFPSEVFSLEALFDIRRPGSRGVQGAYQAHAACRGKAITDA